MHGCCVLSFELSACTGSPLPIIAQFVHTRLLMGLGHTCQQCIHMQARSGTKADSFASPSVSPLRGPATPPNSPQ
eukprot:789513-Pelagomonas_calceolata.AAC.1